MDRTTTLLSLLLALGMAAGTPALAQDEPPAWAFVINPPGLEPPPDDGVPRHVPDSDAAFTTSQTRDLFFAPDWHPGDHPPMPEIVARGRKPDVMACGVCHRAGGTGGPENASLDGLPAVYIAQQMGDFKSGARKSSVPHGLPVRLMVGVAKAATTAEVETAAAYFSALKPHANRTVVETGSAPKSYVTGWHLAAAATGETEPLGRRIVEVPENLEHFESRDGRARFIVYVPPGSVEQGRRLASGEGGRTPCGVCHGPELKGIGPIPGIAGRSPSYMVRQLYDFRSGARAGIGSALMRPVVETMSPDNMISLAAYAASLSP